jgi:GDP-mannose 6-dehydrogenase
MDISIFGLGYVGCVSLGCLAKAGHNVIGIDINQTKIGLINQGLPTIIEKDIDSIIHETYIKGKIRATSDYEDAVKNSDISIICVGTPSTEKGHLDLTYIYNTAGQIGSALRKKKEFHIVAIRSTVLPGTNEKVGKIIEEISGKKRNEGFAIVSNPEFLREGSAVQDYFNPSLTIVGCENDLALNKYLQIYEQIDAPVEKTTIQIAEIMKYVNNSYHALKIVFANEIGNICKTLNIDSYEVMRIFCLDTHLNISSNYFKPGFAYGGSCLPKDLKALKTLSHDNYLITPVIDSIEESNEAQVKNAQGRIEKSGKFKVLFLGISFKAGTDDLRQSPVVSIIEYLAGKGYQVKIYDKNINLSKLIGKNKSYIIEKLPHLDNLLIDDIQQGLNWAELVIITNRETEYETIVIPSKTHILDLVRIPQFEKHPNYEGLLW